MGFKRFFFAAAGAIILTTTGFASQSFAFRGHPGPFIPVPGVVVGIPLPPPVIIPSPPELVVVPRTNVYVAPDVEEDMVFYQGFWWRPYEGRWYRSRSYNGPWGHIVHERVPGAIIGLPPDFRYSYRDQRRIHHREVERNWNRWERERHWEREHHRYRD